MCDSFMDRNSLSVTLSLASLVLFTFLLSPARWIMAKFFSMLTPAPHHFDLSKIPLYHLPGRCGFCGTAISFNYLMTVRNVCRQRSNTPVQSSRPLVQLSNLSIRSQILNGCFFSEE
jgi:hypothetical protein